MTVTDGCTPIDLATCLMSSLTSDGAMPSVVDPFRCSLMQKFVDDCAMADMGHSKKAPNIRRFLAASPSTFLAPLLRMPLLAHCHVDKGTGSLRDPQRRARVAIEATGAIKLKTALEQGAFTLTPLHESFEDLAVG